MFTRKAVNLASFPKSVTVFGARKWPIEARLRVVPHFSSGIIISRASETRAHVKITKREKGDGVSPFLTWGDFHARSRFARSTIPEEKWGTTCSLYWCILSLMLAYVADAKKEGERGGEKRDLCSLSLRCLFWILFHQLYACVTLFRLCLHCDE